LIAPLCCVFFFTLVQLARFFDALHAHVRAVAFCGELL
jgi:hypothetical protein